MLVKGQVANSTSGIKDYKLKNAEAYNYGETSEPKVYCYGGELTVNKVWAGEGGNTEYRRKPTLVLYKKKSGDETETKLDESEYKMYNFQYLDDESTTYRDFEFDGDGKVKGDEGSQKANKTNK